ncbi:MAG: response regulator [Candidatus Latescibacterota bacterium]
MSRILIVDASEAMRELLGRHLAERGYAVCGVGDGVQAARRMRQERPDLLLIDEGVPLDGVRTARVLRLHPDYGRIPIVLCVNGQRAGEELVEAGRQANLNAFIVKPCTAATLESKVREALRQPLEPLSVAVLRSQLAGLAGLPVLRPAHQRILSLLAREDAEVDVPDLARCLETDPGLTTRVLRISRSAFYGFRGNTLAGAVTFLGVDRIRKVVHASLVFDLFQGGDTAVDADGFGLAPLWRHSVACGVIMERAGQRVKGRDHFVAGILHDIGKVTLYLRFRPYFEELRRTVLQEGTSMRRAEAELLGFTHAQIGHELARQWDLPPTLSAAIGFHHEPSAALLHRRLASLVHLGDRLARELEIGHGGDRRPIAVDEVAAPLARYVAAVAAEREQIAAEVESVVQEGHSSPAEDQGGGP